MSSKRRRLDGYSTLNLKLSRKDIAHLQSYSEKNQGVRSQFTVPPADQSSENDPDHEISCSIIVRCGNDIVYSTTTEFTASPEFDRIVAGETQSSTPLTIPSSALNYLIQYTAVKQHGLVENTRLNQLGTPIPDNLASSEDLEALLALGKDRSSGLNFGIDSQHDFSTYSASDPTATVIEKKIKEVRGKGIKRGSRLGSKTCRSYFLEYPFSFIPYPLTSTLQLSSCLRSLCVRPGIVLATHEEVKFVALIYSLFIAKRPYIIKYDNKRRGMFRLSCAQCPFVFRSTNLNVYGEYAHDSQQSYHKSVYPNIIYVTEFVPHSCQPHLQISAESSGDHSHRNTSTKWHNYLALLFDFFGHPGTPPSAEEKRIALAVIEQIYMVVEGQALNRSFKSKMSRIAFLVSMYNRGGFDVGRTQDIISKLHIPALILQVHSPDSLVRIYYSFSDTSRLYAPPARVGSLNDFQTRHYKDVIEKYLPNYRSSTSNFSDFVKGTDMFDVDVESFIQDQLGIFGGTISSNEVKEEVQAEWGETQMEEMLNERPVYPLQMSPSFIDPDMNFKTISLDIHRISVEHKSQLNLLNSLKLEKITVDRLEGIRNIAMRFNVLNPSQSVSFPELKSLAVVIKPSHYAPSICSIEHCDQEHDQVCKKHANLQNHHEAYTEFVQKRMNVNPHVFANAVEQVFPDWTEFEKNSFKGLTIITGDMRRMAHHILPVVCLGSTYSGAKIYGSYGVLCAVGYTIENEMTILGVSIADSETDDAERWLEFLRDLSIAYDKLFKAKSVSFVSGGGSGISYALQTVFPNRFYFQSFQHWKEDVIKQIPLKKRNAARELLVETLVPFEEAKYQKVLFQLQRDYVTLDSSTAVEDSDLFTRPVAMPPTFGHFSCEASDAFYRLLQDALKMSPLRLPFHIHNLQLAIAQRTKIQIESEPCIKFFGDQEIVLTPRCSEMLALACLFTNQFQVSTVPGAHNGIFQVTRKVGSLFEACQDDMNSIPLLFESLNLGRGNVVGSASKIRLQNCQQNSEYLVDLTARTCSCTYFQDNMIPCIHALSVILGKEGGESTHTISATKVSQYCASVFYSTVHGTTSTGSGTLNTESLNPTLAQLLYFTEFFKNLKLRKSDGSGGLSACEEEEEEDDIVDEGGNGDDQEEQDTEIHTWKQDYLASFTENILSQLAGVDEEYTADEYINTGIAGPE